MGKIIVKICVIFFLAGCGATLLYINDYGDIFYPVSLLCRVVVFHLLMRLCLGYASEIFLRGRFNYRARWFAEKGFEKKLYRIVKVKKWKSSLPTFNPRDFQVKTRTSHQLLQATCQAETVHEIIMLLSFVPVLFSTLFGYFYLFLSTSIIACLAETVFIMAQRFNRPRILKLHQKTENRR